MKTQQEESTDARTLWTPAGRIAPCVGVVAGQAPAVRGVSHLHEEAPSQADGLGRGFGTTEGKLPSPKSGTGR